MLQLIRACASRYMQFVYHSTSDAIARPYTLCKLACCNATQHKTQHSNIWNSYTVAKFTR